MRTLLIAMLVLMGIALTGPSAVTAAPVNGGAVNATIIDNVQPAACWQKCNKWGKCWTSCSGGPALVVPQLIVPAPIVRPGCGWGFRWSRRWQRCVPI
jgi:hypothetical protein